MEIIGNIILILLLVGLWLLIHFLIIKPAEEKADKRDEMQITLARCVANELKRLNDNIELYYNSFFPKVDEESIEKYD